MADLGKEWGKVVTKAKTFGGRFVIEFFIEQFHDQLIEEFQKQLVGFTPEDIKKMVEEHKFIEFDQKVYNALHGYEDFLKRIKTERLYEALMTAREDLGTALWKMGDPDLPPEQKPGLQYLIDFRKYILARVRAVGTEEAPAENQAAGDTTAKTIKIVKAICDKCNKSWPVPEDKFKDIKKCPFCGAPAGGTALAA